MGRLKWIRICKGQWLTQGEYSACQVWVSALFFVRPVWHAIAQMQLLIASFVHIIFCSLWIHLFSFLLSRTSSKILPWSSNLIPISEVFIFLKCVLSSSCLLITMMFSFYRCSSFFMNYGEILSWRYFQLFEISFQKKKKEISFQLLYV